MKNGTTQRDSRLFGTTYSFQHEKKTAADARDFCSSIGSKLFEPKNLPSNAFVAHEAKAKGISQFWIGIHDLQREDVFRYDSNDEEVTWKNWNSDQPNNNLGGEDCVAIGLTKMSNSNGNGETNVDNSGYFPPEISADCRALTDYRCQIILPGGAR